MDAMAGVGLLIGLQQTIKQIEKKNPCPHLPGQPNSPVPYRPHRQACPTPGHSQAQLAPPLCDFPAILGWSVEGSGCDPLTKGFLSLLSWRENAQSPPFSREQLSPGGSQAHMVWKAPGLLQGGDAALQCPDFSQQQWRFLHYGFFECRYGLGMIY